MIDQSTDESSALVLYSTSACHLCEEAEALLMMALEAGVDCHYRKVDISTDDSLFERYGWSIPVIARPDGTELNWPFDSVSLSEFLR